MASREWGKRVLGVAQQPSFWALIFLLFNAFMLGWVYQLNRDTNELAKENAALTRANRATLVKLKRQDVTIRAALKHQCQTDAAHDIAVRQFIKTTKNLDTLEALLGLHFFLIDTKTCRDVTG